MNRKIYDSFTAELVEFLNEFQDQNDCVVDSLNISDDGNEFVIISEIRLKDNIVYS